MEANQAPREMDTDETPSVCQELIDMVLTMSHAHRHDVGDLVWFSWNAHPPGFRRRRHRTCHPDHGSQCIGFTKAGARVLSAVMPRHKPQLFDLWLLHNLREGQEGELHDDLCSYVCPPIGG